MDRGATGRVRMTQYGEGASPLRLSAGTLMLGALIACAGGPPQMDPTWKLIQITDVRMVVGDWEGAVKKNEALLPEGPVRLMIRANHTYLFAGETADAIAVGSGRVDIADGRLVGDSERRAVTFTLYDHKGNVVLVVDATKHDTKDRYHGEFTKAQ
jgi:hypothetical protein